MFYPLFVVSMKYLSESVCTAERPTKGHPSVIHLHEVRWKQNIHETALLDPTDIRIYMGSLFSLFTRQHNIRLEVIKQADRLMLTLTCMLVTSIKDMLLKTITHRLC